uniref:Replication factor A C-terminal domain-containing protein n=1 Tax=Tetranychus urticae TaxID=32264 RepID=T1KWA7_TETUR
MFSELCQSFKTTFSKQLTSFEIEAKRLNLESVIISDDLDIETGSKEYSFFYSLIMYYLCINFVCQFIHNEIVVRDANKRWSDLEHCYELAMNSASILKLDANNNSICLYRTKLKKRDISLVDDSDSSLTDYSGKWLYNGNLSIISRGRFNYKRKRFLNSIKKTNNACAGNATLITNCIATITQIGKASIYMACPENCRKKLVPLDDGFHKCEKCNKQFVKGDYKIIINFCISDVTDSVWVTAFSEVAVKLIGIKVVDIEKLADDDEKKLGEILDTMLFKKFNFRIKSNLDNYNEDKLRCNVLAVSTINTINYTNKLLEDINKLITN